MLSEVIDLLRVVLCFCLTWGLIIYSILNTKKALIEGIKQLKLLHQIPCSGCNYFTNDYRLKCTIDPSNALSEEAIGCIHFEPGCCNMNGATIRSKKSKLF